MATDRSLAGDTFSYGGPIHPKRDEREAVSKGVHP